MMRVWSMRWMLIFGMFVAALSCSSAAEEKKWKEGDRVLALWKLDKDWYYVGTIREFKEGQYVVVFDDGDKDTLAPAHIFPEDIAVGDKIAGNFKRQGVFYPGKITSRKGDQVHIKYDDGDEEDTTIAMLRVKRPR